MTQQHFAVRTPQRVPAWLHRLAATAAFATLALTGTSAYAEPYFAIMTGQKCVACHTNVTGGGKRTQFGNAFSQKQLSSRVDAKFWDGTVMEYLSVGGDTRVNLSADQVPNQDDSFSLDLDETLVYIEMPLMENRLTLYVDQEVGPSTNNREAFVLLKLDRGSNNAYLKAGKFFLPFGWRIEDDGEFVRQVSGINYNTPDTGLEGGVDMGRNSLRLAITNGTAGGSEIDRGKQYSFTAQHVRNRWRAGISLNHNDAGSDARRMAGVFAGLRTGPVSWLAEVDYLEDKGLGPIERKQLVSFVEANWWMRQGHNLKFSYGHFDPDDDLDEDERNRFSLVYEYFLLPFGQLRFGVRINDGIPQNDLQNIDQYFMQLHAYF